MRHRAARSAIGIYAGFAVVGSIWAAIAQTTFSVILAITFVAIGAYSIYKLVSPRKREEAVARLVDKMAEQGGIDLTNEPETIALEPVGIRVSASDGGETLVPYTRMREVTRINDTLLVVGETMPLITVPIAAFPDEAQQSDFVARVEESIAAAGGVATPPMT